MVKVVWTLGTALVSKQDQLMRRGLTWGSSRRDKLLRFGSSLVLRGLEL